MVDFDEEIVCDSGTSNPMNILVWKRFVLVTSISDGSDDMIHFSLAKDETKSWHSFFSMNAVFELRRWNLRRMFGVDVAFCSVAWCFKEFALIEEELDDLMTVFGLLSLMEWDVEDTMVDVYKITLWNRSKQ